MWVLLSEERLLIIESYITDGKIRRVIKTIRKYFEVSWAKDEYDMRNKTNIIIRIIESDMVVQAMEYVLKANSRKLDVPEIKENAKLVLEHLESGKLKMPIFED